MSIRKVTICLAVILFISATVLAFTSNKRAEKKAEKEYTPTVQTVTMTAVGDCTLATDINADPNGSFKSVAESLNGDYSYFFKNVAPIFSEDDLTIVNFEGTLSSNVSIEGFNIIFLYLISKYLSLHNSLCFW